MYFQRFYNARLAQASYIIGCQRTGEAVVVDANRDVQQYLDAAAKEGLRVTHVTETHIHADFVSGSRELAHRAGAQILLSDEGGPDWRYTYARDAGAVLLKDGDHFMVGNIKLEVVHTPGHTPEHISFLVTDTPAGSGPWGILTGDFVFVGDVGRPDLLERAAGIKDTMKAGAHTLFHSLERFRDLPDHLQVWPGHGAGSACGKALGAVPSTTVGYEKIGNWGVGTTDEEVFVRTVLEGQPEPPRYFAEMKRINKADPGFLSGALRPAQLPASAFERLMNAKAPIVDTRPAAEFADAHVAGTLNIPLATSFTTWAGWLLPYDRDIYLIADNIQAADDAIRDLSMIGLDRVTGIFGTDVLDSWRVAGHELGTINQTTPNALAAMLENGDVTVVDVRGHAEWEAGHLPGVCNIPLGYLAERIAELPKDNTIVVHCQSGARSAIAAAVLQAKGVNNVVNLVGGITAWQEAGLPVVRGDEQNAEREAGFAVGV